MKTQRFSWILYLIVATILITIGVQVFWNYKNYKANEQAFKNQVQLRLDNAVEAYFADVAKNNRMAFVGKQSSTKDSVKQSLEFIDELNLDSIFASFATEAKKEMDISVDSIKGFTQITGSSKGFQIMKPDMATEVAIFRGQEADSVKMIQGITSLYVSIVRDSLDFKKLASFFQKELDRSNMEFPYILEHYQHDSLITSFMNEMHSAKKYIKTKAKSTYLKQHDTLELQYTDITFYALRESFSGILLSTLLSLAIISSLFYLLHVIRKQKELAEIKNDLISNITHEFKTPITTISTAIEAIQHFDADKEKTKKYLAISDTQLKKLHVMVEKLLETATLDSEKLLLKKEALDLVPFLERITNKHQVFTTKKTITFKSNVNALPIHVDAFHFENAIANLIDNAIKYGGTVIEVNLNAILNDIEISVTDNGGGIDKLQRDKIFDKFYRIPKGNTHDVKGFGIGLYYTKKIVEKHEGTIALDAKTDKTTFKITLSND